MRASESKLTVRRDALSAVDLSAWMKGHALIDLWQWHPLNPYIRYTNESSRDINVHKAILNILKSHLTFDETEMLVSQQASSLS